MALQRTLCARALRHPDATRSGDFFAAALLKKSSVVLHVRASSNGRKARPGTVSALRPGQRPSVFTNAGFAIAVRPLLGRWEGSASGARQVGTARCPLAQPHPVREEDERPEFITTTAPKRSGAQWAHTYHHRPLLGDSDAFSKFVVGPHRAKRSTAASLCFVNNHPRTSVGDRATGVFRDSCSDSATRRRRQPHIHPIWFAHIVTTSTHATPRGPAHRFVAS